MYKYLPIEQVKVGDVVEFINNEYYKNVPINSIHIVNKVSPNGNSMLCSSISDSYLQSDKRFKLIATKPGSEAVVGDTIIRYKDGTPTMPTGGIFTALKVDSSCMYYTQLLSTHINDCLVLCKASELRHQKWKDLYDQGVELEWFNRSSESKGWRPLSGSATNFSNMYYEYRIKQQTRHELAMAQWNFGNDWYVPVLNSNTLCLNKSLQIVDEDSASSFTILWTTESEANLARAQYIEKQMEPHLEIGMQIMFRDEAKTELRSYKPGLIGTIKNIIDRVNQSPLIRYTTPKGNPSTIDSLWIKPYEPEIKIGSHWERLDIEHSKTTPMGEIVSVVKLHGDGWILWNNNISQTYSTTERFLKCFKPRPDLDAQQSTIDKEALTFQVGDIVEFVRDQYNSFPGAKQHLGKTATVIATEDHNIVTVDNIPWANNLGDTSNRIHTDYLKHVTTKLIYTEPVTVTKEQGMQSFAEFQSKKQKEQPMNRLDLRLLSAIMAALSSTEVEQDATNSEFICVLTKDNNYEGYFYSKSEDDYNKVMQKAENAEKKLHVFKYQATVAQKPAKIVEVERS